MNDCAVWLSLLVTILKIVLAVLEMRKARRANELVPRSWTSLLEPKPRGSGLGIAPGSGP